MVTQVIIKGTTIRKYITFQVAQTLVQSMVMSHLDYGNSLLYGISEHLLTKLQRVQNAAGRVILEYTKYDHITPGLVKLHWLPIKYRILFKITMITYKAISNNQPKYLQQHVVIAYVICLIRDYCYRYFIMTNW